jgi:hypothetical protein
MAKQPMTISRQLRAEGLSTRTMLQSRSRKMRKFSKQLKFLVLGLMVAGSLGLSLSSKMTLVGVAMAKSSPTPDPNCPTITGSGNGPLVADSAYGFYAFGADSSGGANATVTISGDVQTDNNGCPSEVFFGFNDNGTSCTGTFSSVTTKSGNSGTMTWTPTSGCITSANIIQFQYSNAPATGLMYIANNGGGSGLGLDLIVQGKLEFDTPSIFGGVSSGTVKAANHE